ncbi:ComEC family competence protein [Candidatus Gracilibacteria bacterium]|nr:ComEC family competence protein [Candidatus Gracilibacteria bacterium]MCF7898563.1 ComEC family competence protein [Candidatus Paceibacterota bacterium]
MTTHTKTLIFVIGTLLGVAIGEVSMYASEVGMFALILFVTQGVLYLWERKRKMISDVVDITYHFSFPLITALFCFGLFIGVVRVQLVEEKTIFTCESSCTFDAKIISSPETKNEYQIFNIRPLVATSEMYDVQVRTPLYPKYKIGETLSVGGKITIPSIIMPHEDNSGFDYASYLRTKNVGSEIMFPHIEVIDTEAKTLTDILGRLKENFVMRIDRYASSPESSLATGMLFGATSMSKELLQTFRASGLSHIIVLSGFNIVIVIATILFILSFLPLVLRITFASISVILFVMMVGGSPSVVRATLMAFIALLAMLVGRLYVAKQALLISLFAIIMYEPHALINDVSLHLSFLATMGLVYFSEPLEIFFKKYFSRVSIVSLREIFITTLAAYFATLPYVMFTFGKVSMYALIANILVVPLVPIAMLLSFMVVLSSYVSETLSLVISFIDSTLVSFIIWVALTIERLPFSMVVITVSFWGMCLTYLFIFLCAKYLFKKTINETRVTTENGNLTDIISY